MKQKGISLHKFTEMYLEMCVRVQLMTVACTYSFVYAYELV